MGNFIILVLFNNGILNWYSGTYFGYVCLSIRVKSINYSSWLPVKTKLNACRKLLTFRVTALEISQKAEKPPLTLTISAFSEAVPLLQCTICCISLIFSILFISGFSKLEPI